MIVVGLDLSLISTGIAVSRYPEPLRVRSTGKAGATLAQRNARLYDVAAQVLKTIENVAPDLVVIEAPAFDSRTGHQHDRSGLWWMVVQALFADAVPIAEVTTGSLKKYATGKGNAGKDAVIAETVRRYPDWPIDGNDVADALVLCAMGCDHLGQPLAALPQTYRDALLKVAWP